MKRFIAVVLAIVLIISTAQITYATNEAIGGVEQFTGHITQSDNYSLDVMELGIFDSGTIFFNNISNAFFGLALLVVEMTCTIFYYATTVNLSEILSFQIGDVQKSLKDKVFDSMFPLVLGFSGLWIAWLMFKRNSQEILNQVIKVFIVLVSVSLVALHSTSVIAMVDGVTSLVSNKIMAGISMKEESTSSYGVTTAQILWDTLIHQPWLTLEFGDYEPEDGVIEEILGTAPTSEDRKKIIEKIVNGEEEPVAFGKEMPLKRLPLVLLYSIPLTVKCVIYAAIALLQLAFRIMTILLVFMGILILLLSLIPQLGGTELIKKWALKIAEMQIMILILTFMLGFMTMIDTMLYTQVNKWGWLVVMVVQTVVALFVFLFRNKILGFFGKAQKSIQNPTMAIAGMQAQLSRTGGVFAGAQVFNNGATAAAHNTINGIKTKIGEAADGLRDVGSYYHPKDNEPDIQQQSRTPTERPTLVPRTPAADEAAPTQNNSDMRAVKGRGAVRLETAEEELTPTGTPSSERPTLVVREAAAPKPELEQEETERPVLVTHEERPKQWQAEEQQMRPSHPVYSRNTRTAVDTMEQTERPVLVMQEIPRENSADGIALNASETSVEEHRPERPTLDMPEKTTVQAPPAHEGKQPELISKGESVKTPVAPQKRPATQEFAQTPNITGSVPEAQIEPRRAVTTANLDLGGSSQREAPPPRQSKLKQPVLETPVTHMEDAAPEQPRPKAATKRAQRLNLSSADISTPPQEEEQTEKPQPIKLSQLA